MADNDWKKRLGVVFSTNPDFAYEQEAEQEEETLELIADVENHLKKFRRFCYLAIGGVILAAVAALIFVAIVK